MSACTKIINRHHRSEKTFRKLKMRVSGNLKVL